jgi:hypothetical protein
VYTVQSPSHFVVLSSTVISLFRRRYVGFEVLTAVVMNVAIFWDIAQCNPYVNRRFGGTHHLRLQGRKSDEQETSDCLATCYWLVSRSADFYHEYGDNTFLRNVGSRCTTQLYIKEDGNIHIHGMVFMVYNVSNFSVLTSSALHKCPIVQNRGTTNTTNFV